MASVAVSLHNVSKTFGEQRALVDVSFDINEGEIHALVGENGSGKSTLIKVLSGFHAPDPGSAVAVAGAPLQFADTESSRQLGLRFVHQDLGLIEEFSVLENFGLTSGFHSGVLGIDWGPLAAIAQACLARVGVSLDLDAQVSSLTAVERTALAIARTLDDSELGPPKLLVLDEPTAALPTEDAERLFGIVREVAAQGVAIMYVSHRLDEVMELCSRITALRDGVIVGSGRTSEFDRRSLAELIVGAAVAEDDTRVPPDPGLEPVVRIHGLTTSTLAPLYVEILPGEIVGVVGLDGSGRENLARGLVGDAGGAADLFEVAGTAVTSLSPAAAIQAGVGLVLANREAGAAVPGMSIRENLSLVSVSSGRASGIIDRGREAAAAQHMMTELDIRPFDMERDYATLSGGNKQKVIFGKWVGVDPVFLVLDDPTSGVDVGARRAMYGEIQRVAQQGTAVLVASSDVEDIARLCHRALVLIDGVVTRVLVGADITEGELAAAITPDSTP